MDRTIPVGSAPSAERLARRLEDRCAQPGCGEIEGLARLAEAVRSQLAPTAARADFARDLRRRLTTMSDSTVGPSSLPA